MTVVGKMQDTASGKQEAGAFDLECRDVIKTFGNFTAVDNVSFSVPRGSFFSILGPSGCGKTTLLRMVAGFAHPDSGDILIKGRSVLDEPPNRRPVNMVFQHLALFPMMNVAGNIGYGLRRQRVSKDEITRRVGDALERVGLERMGHKDVSQLSGGQKQRVAIARAMVLEPDVLLLDEPLGALDLKLREHMKVELKKLQSNFGTTFVYITHDQGEALVMSDQVAVMNKGRFEQVGPPASLYYKPQTAFIAGFVGDTNQWHGQVLSADQSGVKVSTGSDLNLVAVAAVDQIVDKGDAVSVFVRPESIALAHDEVGLGAIENRMTGEVVSLLFNGANSRVLVREESTCREVDIALPQAGEMHELTPGVRIHFGWRQDQAQCFQSDKSEDVG